MGNLNNVCEKRGISINSKYFLWLPLFLNICKFKLGLFFFFSIYLVINLSLYLEVNLNNLRWTVCLQHAQIQLSLLVQKARSASDWAGLVSVCSGASACGGRTHSCLETEYSTWTATAEDLHRNKIFDSSIRKFRSNVQVFYSCSESKTMKQFKMLFCLISLHFCFYENKFRKCEYHL